MTNASSLLLPGSEVAYSGLLPGLLYGHSGYCLAAVFVSLGRGLFCPCYYCLVVKIHTVGYCLVCCMGIVAIAWLLYRVT